MNYVNNPDFLEALRKYKEEREVALSEGKEEPRIPPYIGECIYKIATRLATRPNFYSYTYKNDMISDGLENAIACVGNFNPEKSNNPFAYFTQVIWYAFLRRIDKEKKQEYIKYKTTENAVLSGMVVEGDTDIDPAYIDLNDDYVSDFVTNFESKIKKRSKKKGLEQVIEEPDDTSSDRGNDSETE